MPRYTLKVNGERRAVDAPAEMPLLWALRDLLGLTGTKYGCGTGQCRSCVVQVDGAPTPSCLVPVSGAGGKEITTIEGLSGPVADRVRAAWIAEDVPQCGYCQPGWVMATEALLRANPRPTDDDVVRALDGHLCRCGTYARVRRAVRRAADGAGAGGAPPAAGATQPGGAR